MADIITGMIKRYAADDRFTMEPDPAGKGIKLVFNDKCWFEMAKMEAELKKTKPQLMLRTVALRSTSTCNRS